MKAIRTPVDGKQEEFSLQAGIDCTDLPDMTRQEYKDEVDVNFIMDRFGVPVANQPLAFGEIDFDIDLQQAHMAATEAELAHMQLTSEQKAKYPHWSDMLNAVVAGEFTLTKKEETPAPKETPAAAAAAGSSEPDPGVT